MSEIMILAVCFQLKQLKKQPEKNSGSLFHSCLSAVHICDFHIFIFIFIIQRIDALPKYGQKTLDVRRST